MLAQSISTNQVFFLTSCNFLFEKDQVLCMDISRSDDSDHLILDSLEIWKEFWQVPNKCNALAICQSIDFPKVKISTRKIARALKNIHSNNNRNRISLNHTKSSVFDSIWNEKQFLDLYLWKRQKICIVKKSIVNWKPRY